MLDAIEETAENKETIPTNLRLLFLLEAVAQAGAPVTPTEVNAEIGLPKPTIHRLFATLEQEAFLQRDIDGRSYIPGPRLQALSFNTLSSMRLHTARVAVLSRLSDEIGETCNIAIPDRNAMLYLDRVETKWPLRIQLPVGSHVPFHCTASGKMYLSTLGKTHLDRYLRSAAIAPRTPHTITDRRRLAAEIARTQERGYSIDAEEFMEGMIAIAVPVHDDTGRLVSTLSFHAPTQRLSLDKAHDHIPTLQKNAEELARLIPASRKQS